MLTMIVLTGDSKLAGQIEIWVRQFMGDRLRAESYKSITDYKAMLDRAVEARLGQPVNNETDADAEAKQIRLFVIDLELIQAKPTASIAEIQQVTSEKARFLLGDVTPKVLIMGFEGGTHRPEQLQHESIDDLLLKPVDRSLLLQKTEFLISDNAKAQPTFLFRAKTSQIVEVGRDVTIDEISEFAVSVRSPGPVPDGSFASVHADVFGPKGGRRLIGRVYESVRHPVREGEFVVRFSYFGLSAEQLSTVRRYIKTNQTAVRTKTWGKEAPAKTGMSKELQEKMALLKVRKIAIIDMNPETLSEAKSALEGGFKGLTVRAFPSYTRMMADLTGLLPNSGKPAAVPGAGKPATPEPPKGIKALALPGGRKLGVILRGKNRELARFEPALQPSDRVLSRPAKDWLDKPDQFVLAVEREDREGFEEFLDVIESGTPGRVTFRMYDAMGQVCYFDATGTTEKSATGDSVMVRVDLQEVDLEHWTKSQEGSTAAGGGPIRDPSYFRFDAIIIDGAFLRPDPAAWCDRFVELLRATKVLGIDDQPPKIFVLSDPKARLRMEDFRIKTIVDFSLKPLDRRMLVQKVNAFFPTLVPLREPEAPPFIPCELPAKLGKEVVMEEVSEYGLLIVNPTPFREKSFMRFFSPLFGEEGGWVAGKCHYCEKAGEGEAYRCAFTFFGPADELTMRIRRWIREDYVAKKDVNNKN